MHTEANQSNYKLQTPQWRVTDLTHYRSINSTSVNRNNLVIDVVNFSDLFWDVNIVTLVCGI